MADLRQDRKIYGDRQISTHSKRNGKFDNSREQQSVHSIKKVQESIDEYSDVVDDFESEKQGTTKSKPQATKAKNEEFSEIDLDDDSSIGNKPAVKKESVRKEVMNDSVRSKISTSENAP